MKTRNLVILGLAAVGTYFLYDHAQKKGWINKAKNAIGMGDDEPADKEKK